MTVQHAPASVISLLGGIPTYTEGPLQGVALAPVAPTAFLVADPETRETIHGSPGLNFDFEDRALLLEEAEMPGSQAYYVTQSGWSAACVVRDGEIVLSKMTTYDHRMSRIRQGDARAAQQAAEILAVQLASMEGEDGVRRGIHRYA